MAEGVTCLSQLIKPPMSFYSLLLTTLLPLVAAIGGCGFLSFFRVWSVFASTSIRTRCKSSSASERSTNQSRCCRRRYEAVLVTHATSNRTLTDLAGLDPRIASVLTGSCEPIGLTGKDRRLVEGKADV